MCAVIEQTWVCDCKIEVGVSIDRCECGYRMVVGRIIG